METTVTEERDDQEMDNMEDLPPQEILRENLMKPKKKKKRAKAKKVEPRCPECLKVYCDKNGLAKHMLIHSKEYPFWCPQCDYKAKTKQYLARHVKRVHNGPPNQHRCSYCDKAFHFKCALVNHERVHTGAKPYSCDVCGKSFSALYSLNTHKFIHTDEKPFKCTFCEYACRDSSTLRKHKRRHMGTLKMWPCDICSKKYDTKCGLRVHMTEVHIEPDVRKYKCEICDGTFKKPWVLNKHIESVHARSKTCVCVVCNVTVPDYNNLKAHMRSHVDVRPFRCASCPTWFKDRDTLKRHGRVHNKQRLICDICGAGFSRKNLIIQHMKVMHLRRKKTVGCDYCGVRFYTKQYLAKHIRQKHNRKRQKYICDWCDFETHNKPSIVMHIKHGHNLDKGKCKICDKAYKRERFLRLHYKNAHNLKFKSDTKVEDIVIPETTELRIKEEPLDLPDLEIDLLEIDKEEPFAGFEPTDLELSSALPDVLEKLKEKEQTLQEYFDQVMNNSERDDVTVAADTDNQQSEIQSQHQELNQLPSQDLTSMPVEVFIKRITEDTAEETLGEDLDSYDKTLITLTNVQSLNQESNLSSEDKLPESSQAEDEFAQPIEGIGSLDETKKEAVLPPSDTTRPAPKDKQTKKRKKTLKKIRKAKAQRTPMPVQEFLQKFVGDTHITKHDSVIVDHNSLAAAESRLKELLMKMNRTDSGKVGVMKNTSGKNTIKLFTQQEIEVIKSNPEASKKPQNDEDDEGAGSDKQNGDDDDDKAGEEGTPRILKSFRSMHQCYVCFKIFDSKPKLIDHCKEHFDVCNEVTLKKCPLCAYVTTKSDIRKHLRKKHKEDVKISFMNIKKKSNASGSSYYYDTTNDKIKELDIIPSIKILNKKACMEIDKKNRERKNKLVGKHKLVRKGNEWIVEKEKIDLSGHFLPDSKDLDKNSENYLDIIKKLGKEAKRKGVKMLYPCNKCDKLCQNLSALTLHSRKHDPNPKPFRPRGWIRKDKEKKLKMAKNLEVNTENRLAKPKPVVNNHKCDPKLIDFYENNIKGGDIEFWQFLKIYNKMDREHVNSFEDLQVNHEYGMHNIYKSSEGADSAPKNNQNELTLQNNSHLEETSKVNSNKKDNTNAKSKNSSLLKDGKKIGNKGKIKKLNNKFVRTVQITKSEHDKRMEIKRQLREKLLAEAKS